MVSRLRLALPALGLLAAAGCAVLKVNRHPELAPGRWERSIAVLGVDPATIENPIGYTPEMRDAARSVAGAAPSDLEKLRRLQHWLFDAEAFPFNYASRVTLTAEQAFERRTGNCVTFTNLFIALARSIGLPARAALLTRRGDAEREGDLIVINHHIVAVYEHSGGASVFDFNLRRDRERVGLKLIDDAWITAIYVNNKGTERLLAGGPQEALRDLETAVRLAPDFAPAFGNLGVVYRQLGRDDDAFEAYRRALEIDPRFPTILNNLAALYQSQGRDDEARHALLAASLSGATPYFLLLRGDFERAAGRTRAARRLYGDAARLGPGLLEPWLAIARLEMARGRPAAARRALERALAIAPMDERAINLLESVPTGR